MKSLNKTATKIFNRLTIGLEKFNQVNRFGEPGGSIMPAVVELIGQTEHGPIFSIAHYYKQHGDMMRDPEMTFLKVDEQTVIPMSFQQDGVPAIYQESVFRNGDGNWKVRPRMQKDHTVFANGWMRNIKDQQQLDKQPAEA